ncbi:MAG TPA: beta-galactosidase trimerization domain-containing protein, partial [Clostridia bacterium]
GNEPWKQAQAVDQVRAGSRGKPFWHAEQQGGPLWLQPQVIGRAKEDGRVATAPDIRLWNMISIAGGATGILYPRWRSLLDGPLFGAFGLYSNNGLPNPRSDMGAKVTAWANAPAQDGLFKARPVKGDVGIVVIPETQAFNHLLEQGGKGEFYTHCMWGAYQGFFDNNIQSDWVHIDDIDKYGFLYLPYPVHMTSAHAQKVIDWVRKGGKLVLEGCPAYFGDNISVGAEQPNLGFAEACGVAEDEVEFMPDLGHLIRFDWKGAAVDGGLFLQSYTPATAEVVSHYPDGRVAAVKNRFGKGSILLVGTHPSEGYYRNPSEQSRAFFADLLEDSKVQQHVTLSNNDVRVRLWADEDGKPYLWAINTTTLQQSTTATFSDGWTCRNGKVLWGDTLPEIHGSMLTLDIPPKDVLVIQLGFPGGDLTW